MPHRSLCNRLRDERGIAAVVAIGVMTVLAIVGAGAVTFSTQNAGAAARSKANVVALALAEAGINNAMAVLANPANDPSNGALLPPRISEYEGGFVSWSGELDEAALVWTLTATGVVRNPTGGSSDVRRTLTVHAAVNKSQEPLQPLANQSWNYVTATRTGNACDLTLSSDVVLNTRLYVAGNLCFSSGSRISGGSLAVGGSATLGSMDNSIGSTAAPIADAHVRTGCKYRNQPLHSPCSNADNVYASTVDQTPPALTPPTPDWDGWYAAGAPGPRSACSTSSGPVPTFDNNGARDKSVTTSANLTPSTSYSCVVGPADHPQGQLSWNASTRELSIAGTVFIDGSAKIDNFAMNTYAGQGALYLSGSFYMGSQSKLCAVAAGSDCNASTWNPNTRLLAVVANGNGDGGAFAGNSVQFSSYSRFQGATFATNAVQFGSFSTAYGPMIASNIITCSGMQVVPFPLLTTVPAGLPGQTLSRSRISPPQDFSN